MKTENGATVILLNVPHGFHFGIDYYSYQVTEQFMGFKDIPKGIHFFSYTSDSNVPNTSFFEFLEPGDIKVYEWNTKKEDFETVSKDVENEMTSKFKNNKIYQHVAPYPKEIYKTWCGLSNQISKSLLSKLEPVKKKIFPVSDNNSESKYHIYFTKIPNHLSLKDKTPAEISKMYFDKTEIFETVLTQKTEKEVLGELQFSFILFLIGQNFNGFDQWKKMLNLVCNCDEAIQKHDSFFLNFISVLQFQLETTPDDFFIQDFTSENFLTKCLISFFEIILNQQEKDQKEIVLKQKCSEFKKKMEEKFKITFEDDIDDLPTIVEL
eukprot:gene5540-9360_t